MGGSRPVWKKNRDVVGAVDTHKWWSQQATTQLA